MRSKVVRCSLFYCFLSCGLVLPVSANAVGQAPSGAGLTVNDVIKMVQVKLADDLIVSQVRQNGKPLVLSADDMVRLKTAGASDALIRAILETREVPARAGTPISPPSSAAERLEESDAQARLASHVSRESEGRATLESFRKTDGQSAEVNGVALYRMEFEATILFTKDCKWLREPFKVEFKTREAARSTDSGNFNWNDFLEASQNPGLTVRAGQTAGIAGTLTFEKSEIGWRLRVPVDAKVVSEPGKTVARSSRPMTGNTSPPSPNAPTIDAAVLVSTSDGAMVPLAWQTGSGKYLFGARKAVELQGVSADRRVSIGKDVLLMSLKPGVGPVGWHAPGIEQPGRGMTYQCKVYVFEVAKGKRTAKAKEGIDCSTEAFGTAGEFVKIVVKKNLLPGEYAVGPAEPFFEPGGGPVMLIPFGVAPPE